MSARRRSARILGCAAACAAGLWVATSAARADDASSEACRSKAANTMAIEDCQRAELAQAEARLNTAYGRAMAALPADQKAKLLEAERRWVAFRAADCDAYYGQDTGTIAGIEAGDCMIQHAKDRIRDLATFYEP